MMSWKLSYAHVTFTQAYKVHASERARSHLRISAEQGKFEVARVGDWQNQRELLIDAVVETYSNRHAPEKVFVATSYI